MQLSRFTDYSLRVLCYVAVYPDRLVTLAEISSFYDISLDHLRKVVHNLSKSGYLETFRGKNGGMKLQKSPTSINVGDLIKELEGGGGPLIDCKGLNCRLIPACGLPVALAKAQRAFYEALRQYSLQDVIREEKLAEVFLLDVKNLANE